MKIYKNPWVSREEYFIPTGAAKSAKCEAKKTAGYVVDFWQGKWRVRRSCFYDSALHQMAIVSETRKSIAAIVNSAIIKAVCDAVGSEADNYLSG